MTLKTTLTLLALAGAATGASATTVTDWGVLGPTPDVAYVTYHTTGPVDDVYTFSIGATSDVDGYGEEFEARSVSMPDATFTLYQGSYGSGTQVGAPFSFNNTMAGTLDRRSLSSGTWNPSASKPLACRNRLMSSSEKPSRRIFARSPWVYICSSTHCSSTG